MLAIVGACTGGMTPSGDTGGTIADKARLTGAGSTFLGPLMAEWARLYSIDAPGVTMDYFPVGSEIGIGRLITDEVDFAISEIPLNPKELQGAGGGEAVIQAPVAAGAVGLAFNLEGVEALSLSADVLAAAFSGRITRWNDPAIAADNPGRTLPGTALTPVFRSDPAASTVVFTEYLRRNAKAWPLGVSRVVGFPRGLAASGSDGVARAVKRTPGAIGYTSAVAARREGSPLAMVANRSGAFVAPGPSGVRAALDGATGADEGLALFVPATLEGPAVYPVVAVSHLVFRVDEDGADAEALGNFASWILTEGQRSAESVGYFPVPYAIQLRTYEALKARSTKPIR